MIDENSTFGGFLTTIGEAKQANANALKTPWKLTHLLLGDANGTDPVPAPDQTQLVNQVYRAAINQLSIDPDNPGILIAEVVLPPNIGGWWIRELGIEDEDGDFVAVANCPPSYKPLLAQGSGRNQVVRMHLILSNTANVELKVDPSVVLATREYVDKEIEAHIASRNHPDATTTAKGFMQFATKQEHLDGQRDDRAAKPSGVKAMLDSRIADQSTVEQGESDTQFITPKNLRFGFSILISSSGYIVFPSWLGGLIIQWGTETTMTEGSDINFPFQFPNNCKNVSIGHRASIGSENRGLAGVDPATVTPSGFQITVDSIKGSAVTSNFYYIAVGN